MNINLDQIYHAAEPVAVRIKPSVGKQERLLRCAMCGKEFKPYRPYNIYCSDPGCIKRRHVIRQVDFYRRKIGKYPNKPGRPATIPKNKRSPQLEYYYKKKAGKTNKIEKQLKEI